MNRNNHTTPSLHNLRWQSVDSLLKKHLCRCIGKNAKYKAVVDENSLSVEKVFNTKKFICWYYRNFEFNEFYHTFGTPGIWFHGYLPIKDFGKPEFLYYDERYGYYDFQIKDLEHFYEMLEVLTKASQELAILK